MTSSYISIDFSRRQTQAWLFDNRFGSYRLLEHLNVSNDEFSGQPLNAPLIALVRELELRNGQELISSAGRFQFEQNSNQSGLKAVGITYSIGKPIRVALVGLSEKYSLEALRRLSRFYNTEIVLEISLQNEPNVSIQLEKITNTPFDLLILAGGVDGGPEKALRAMIGNLRLLVQLRGETNRPQIVYLGNQALADYAKMEIEAGDDLHIGGNIQPDSGLEDLSFAAKAIRSAINRLRLKEFPELEIFQDNPRIELMPAEFGRARIGQWLEQIQQNGKSVLQIQLEADFGQLIAIQNGKRMGVWQNFEVDDAMVDAVLAQTDQQVSRESVNSILYNRFLHPDFVPTSIEEMSIEMTCLSLRVQNLLKELSKLHPEFRYEQKRGLLADFEPILISGSEFERMPTARQALIVALNGILPRGITTIVADDHRLIASLGALADFDPMLVSQIIDSDLFTALATVVTVESPLAEGERVLQLEIDEGPEDIREQYEVAQSELRQFENIPEHGLRAYLAPEANSDIGMGLRGLGGWLNGDESVLGLIVDARGRPFVLPIEKSSQEACNDWVWKFGA